MKRLVVLALAAAAFIVLLVIGIFLAASWADDSVQPLVTAEQLLARIPRGQAVRLDHLTSAPFQSARWLGSYTNRVDGSDPDHVVVNSFLERIDYASTDDGCWALVLVASDGVHLTARPGRIRLLELTPNEARRSGFREKLPPHFQPAYWVPASEAMVARIEIDGYDRLALGRLTPPAASRNSK